MSLTLIQAVRDIAGKYPYVKYNFGETVYPHYTKGDCGPGSGCLLGQAMQACGMGDIAEQSDELGEQPIVMLVDKLGVTSQNDIMWLSKVQYFQDTGRMWRDSVKLADRVLSIT